MRNTRVLGLRFLVPFCALLSGLAQAAQGPDLELWVGEQRWIRVPGLSKFSVAGSSVRVMSRSDSLLVKAVAPGISDLSIFQLGDSTQTRSIRVAKAPDSFKASELFRLIGRLEEVEVHGGREGVQVLSGETQSEGECVRLHALQLAFPKEVVDETVLAPTLLARGRSALERWIATLPSATPRPELTEVGGRLLLRGAVSRTEDRRALERSARAASPCARVLLQSLPDESPTIAFKVVLLEVRKSRLHSLGLAWPDGQAGAFRASPWGIARNVSLDVALRALEADGDARVLSEPELVVRAPGEAELFSGGEIPIRATSQYSSQVAWKPYGLLLKLHVSQATTERVRVDISTEVSGLGRAIDGETVPSMQANRLKTQVDAQYDVPLFLSGLVRQETREQSRGIPGLKDIPILGALFGVADGVSERTELVAILLPRRTPRVAPESVSVSGPSLVQPATGLAEARPPTARGTRWTAPPTFRARGWAGVR